MNSLLSRATLRSSRHLSPRTRACLPHPRLLSQEARAKLQSAVASKPVVLFMKGNLETPKCGFSRAVVQVLDLHGVPAEKMQTYDVLQDAELRNDVKEFSDWPTIPQVYVGGEFVGGCDIVLGMHQSGELGPLLEKHKVVDKASTEPAPESKP